MKKLILPIVALTLITFAGCKSPIALVQGNPEPVKGENFIEVQFTYEDMTVGKESEADYVKRRIESDGEEWHEKWVNDRSNRFEPRFLETMNRYTEPGGLKAERGLDNTKYVLIINTYYTEPGFYAAIKNKAAEVSVKATLVERNNPNIPIAIYDIKTPGITAVPDIGTRIQSAYGQAGRFLGSRLREFL